MKIFSSKKWNEYNNQFIDIQIENKQLKADNQNYKDQVATIVEINKELNNIIANLEQQLKDKKIEAKKLKALCTKNNISYAEKRERKNGRK